MIFKLIDIKNELIGYFEVDLTRKSKEFYTAIAFFMEVAISQIFSLIILIQKQNNKVNGIFFEVFSLKIWILTFSERIFALTKFKHLLKLLSRKVEG